MNWIWWFHFSYFQETYNSRLRERYGDDPSTHSNLWMEVESSSGPDKNRVYRLSNTTIENLRMDHSVLIVGSSQSISSTESREFVTLQEHTIHLNEKYERLSTDYEKLCWMIIDMKSQIGATCASPFWPYGPGNDKSPPLPPQASPLF